MIFTAFFKALGQLGDPRFRRVLVFGLLLSVALLVIIYAAFLLAIQALTPDALDLPLLGPVTGLHSLLGWAGLAMIVGLSVFLMMPVAAAFCGLFLDDIAAAVEARHYAFLPPVAASRWGPALIETANLLGLMLLLNLLALGLLAFTGPAYVAIFWLLNGFLLGREYFTTVALRRLPRAEAKAMRRRNLPVIWAAGALMAVPLSFPLINLLVPVLGAATFTHLYHQLAAASR